MGRTAEMLHKWADRFYSETDLGRSLATSVAGALGMAVYLVFGDVVLAVFAAVIAFPLARITAAGLYGRTLKASEQRTERQTAESIYDRLSDREKEVVQAFVDAGGSVLTWSQVNRLALSSPAVESLLVRGVINTSISADGMRETFVLSPHVFDVGQDRRGRVSTPCPARA